MRKNTDRTLKKVIEAVADTISNDPELSDEYLRSIGKDPRQIEASGAKLLNKLKNREHKNKSIK